ncbi:hypothetical protein CAC42_1022 [Sphaceloma murrayae]|uniref:Uncharacterized protein n=1 Tax=Sphaceloma murrayae TaxID=2082308 RepID=A0A2K1R232_9PEZI|nr:hypothetical protein CAC42_1022 [Sphaceloma murrayae]
METPTVASRLAAIDAALPSVLTEHQRACVMAIHEFIEKSPVSGHKRGIERAKLRDAPGLHQFRSTGQGLKIINSRTGVVTKDSGLVDLLHDASHSRAEPIVVHSKFNAEDLGFTPEQWIWLCIPGTYNPWLGLTAKSTKPRAAPTTKAATQRQRKRKSPSAEGDDSADGAHDAFPTPQSMAKRNKRQRYSASHVEHDDEEDLEDYFSVQSDEKDAIVGAEDRGSKLPTPHRPFHHPDAAAATSIPDTTDDPILVTGEANENANASFNEIVENSLAYKSGNKTDEEIYLDVDIDPPNFAWSDFEVPWSDCNSTIAPDGSRIPNEYLLKYPMFLKTTIPGCNSTLAQLMVPTLQPTEAVSTPSHKINDPLPLEAIDFLTAKASLNTHHIDAEEAQNQALHPVGMKIAPVVEWTPLADPDSFWADGSQVANAQDNTIPSTFYDQHTDMHDGSTATPSATDARRPHASTGPTIRKTIPQLGLLTITPRLEDFGMEYIFGTGDVAVATDGDDDDGPVRAQDLSEYFPCLNVTPENGFYTEHGALLGDTGRGDYGVQDELDGGNDQDVMELVDFQGMGQ